MIVCDSHISNLDLDRLCDSVMSLSFYGGPMGTQKAGNHYIRSPYTANTLL